MEPKIAPRIGIAGIAGRMGLAVAAEIKAAGGTLTGGIRRSGQGPEGVALFSDITALAAECDVVIDFTHAGCVARHAAAMAKSGKAWVLGTTGYATADTQAIAAAAQSIAVLKAANFSPGVNLLLALAEKLGTALPAAEYDAEILEMHHRQKLDAPSGTALALGEAVAAGRHVNLADVKVSGRDGQSEMRANGQIGFAALRGGQIPGSHSVLFTAAAEQIIITHHAFDRRIFAQGALQAALWLTPQPPALYTMRDMLRV